MTSGSNSTISSPEFAVKPVPTAVVLPPDFERHMQPLLISLHAGASSRDQLTEFAPLFRGLFEQQSLPPQSLPQQSPQRRRRNPHSIPAQPKPRSAPRPVEPNPVEARWPHRQRQSADYLFHQRAGDQRQRHCRQLRRYDHGRLCRSYFPRRPRPAIFR